MSSTASRGLARRRDGGHTGRAALFAVALMAALGCVGAGAPAPGAVPATDADTARRASSGASRDTVSGLLPAGHGTLRQDAISLRLGQLDALQLRATPLDESVIRLLSPDSYRALAELKRSKAATIAQVARRNGVRDPSVWYVSFFTVQR